MFGRGGHLSMATTPFLMRLTDWLDRRDEASARRSRRARKIARHRAIVVGYGRFGQTVAQMLLAKSIGVTLIDKKPSMIERADEFGTKVYYGDGLRSTCCAPRARRTPGSSPFATTIRMAN